VRGQIALATLLGLAVAAAGALAAVAIRESNEADAQRDVATSRALAGAAMENLDRSPDLAMLLALEAYERVHDQSAEGSYEARHSLVSALTRHPRLRAVLRVDDDPAAAVSFSPDGNRLVASSADGTVRLWDLSTRAETTEPMRGTPTCYTAPLDIDVRFTPDGKTLVQTSCGIASVFEAERGKRRRTVGGSSDPLGEERTYGALSPDGRMLAFFGEYVGFKLLDTLTGARIRRGVGAGRDQLFPIAFSGDGRILAADSYNSVRPARLLEVESGAPLGKPLPGRVLALSPTGDRAAVLGGGKVSVWDVARATAGGKPLAVESVLGAEFDTTGRRLAVSSDDGQVRVWRLTRTGRAREIARLEHDGVTGLHFSPDGTTLATAGMDGTVRLWNVTRPIALAVRMHRAYAAEVEFSPDGRWLAVNGDNPMVLWSVANGRIVGSPRIIDRGIGYDIEFSPDGRTIASAFQEPGEVGLWDVISGRSRYFRTREYWTESVAYSPDGQLLGSAGDGAKFWHPSTRAQIGKQIGAGFDSIAFSPDGQLLATWWGPDSPGGGDGTIKFWDVNDRVRLGEPVRTDANDIAFSPDGRTLAVARTDGSIGLWSVSRRTLIDRLRVHAATSLLACCAEATAVDFSPDGLVLASGGRDGLRLWDATRASPLGDLLRGVDPDIWSVAFSPDGQMLVSAGDDGTVLWDAILLSRNFEEWQSRLCRIASRNLTEAERRRFLPPDESSRKTCTQSS
jgi:WD40 repeat protein